MALIMFWGMFGLGKWLHISVSWEMGEEAFDVDACLQLKYFVEESHFLNGGVFESYLLAYFITRCNMKFCLSALLFFYVPYLRTRHKT